MYIMISHKLGTVRIMITANETYTLSFVTHIICNG